ncbi:MAG: DUF1080 domain-containing protein [Mariniphaga sp.]|jgi:hypothetical protein|nr:DUF1080 domain-containing protein [Mariniphaga sp.]
MRNILLFLLFLMHTVLGFSQENSGFVSLFNGKDLTGWIMPGKIPGFEVIDGIMVAEPQNGSDIFTNQEYANYIFRFEYLLSKVGNSGVLIRCSPQDPWGTGVEVQLLAPWTPYRDDLHCTASLYGHVAVTNRPDETTGIWHEMEIKYDRNIITISVDGQMATVADIDTVESMRDKYIAGAIGFQSNHSHKGEFIHLRNIAVRDLDLEPDYVAGGFYFEDIRFREQAWNAARTIGAPVIGHLAKLMDDENPVAEAGAKQILFDIIANATAPDQTKANRDEIISAIKSEKSNSLSGKATAYLQWLLEMLETTY